VPTVAGVSGMDAAITTTDRIQDGRLGRKTKPCR
jgi:hypothetical protein